MKIGKFSLIVRREASIPRWKSEVEGQYGLAITYWLREKLISNCICNQIEADCINKKIKSKWHIGLRFSLLLSSKRPFLRLTTYSLPRVGNAETVTTQNCVLPI